MSIGEEIRVVDVAGSGTRFVATVAALACLAASCSSVPKSDPPPDVPIRVSVSGIEPGHGPVRCAVFADKRTFLSRSGIHHGTSADSTADTMAFDLLAPDGTDIVVSVFQDVNNNESLDRGAFGVPVEPWGFSGKPMPFGPPLWSACAIRVQRGMTVNIGLIGKD
jgi:uncharacterized protein (DUF2141 family)